MEKGGFGRNREDRFQDFMPQLLFALNEAKKNPGEGYRRHSEIFSEVFNARGNEFRGILGGLSGEHAYLLLKPYADTILSKWGELIRRGRSNIFIFKPSEDESVDLDNLSQQESIEYYRTLELRVIPPKTSLSPLERSGFAELTEADGSPSKDLYLLDKDSNEIIVNINLKGKSEIFTKAAIERYMRSRNKDRRGVDKVRKGFSFYEALDGRILHSRFMGLYEGFIYLLTEDVVKSVTGEGLKALNIPRETFCYPDQLMGVARELRDLTSVARMPGTIKCDGRYKFIAEYYGTKNDTLVYDAFVSGRLKMTEKVLRARFGKELSHLLLSRLERLTGMEDALEFNIKYHEIMEIINRMKALSQSS